MLSRTKYYFALFRKALKVLDFLSPDNFRLKSMSVTDPTQTYTVADLDRLDFGPKPLAVLGHPIHHSLSPAMHNAALNKMRKDDLRFAGWNYFRFDVPPDQLEFALKRLHQKGFIGINLTIPHKVDVLAQLKQVSASAQLMGAVNTLHAQKYGYSGFNTDGFGLEQGLLQDLDQTLTNCEILLLGSGGAARAAAVHCLERGCKRLHIANRNPERLAQLLDQLTAIGRRDAVTSSSLMALPQAWAPNGLVINATSVGLAAGDPSPLDLRQLPPAWKVYDMIYNPARTPLLQQAAASGRKWANGLSMLVHQGARALEIWTQKEIPIGPMQTAAEAALQEANNS